MNAICKCSIVCCTHGAAPLNDWRELHTRLEYLPAGLCGQQRCCVPWAGQLWSDSLRKEAELIDPPRSWREQSTDRVHNEFSDSSCPGVPLGDTFRHERKIVPKQALRCSDSVQRQQKGRCLEGLVEEVGPEGVI